MDRVLWGYAESEQAIRQCDVHNITLLSDALESCSEEMTSFDVHIMENRYSENKEK